MYKDNKLNSSIKMKMFLGIVFFRSITDLIYSKYITNIFRHEGFINDFSIEKFFLSWFILLLFIPLFINLHKKVTFSSVILILLGYISIVPFTTMIAFYPFPLKFIVANTLYWLILYFFYKIMPRFSLMRIKNDNLVNLLINTIILIFSLTIIYISLKYTGFRITLDIFKVYDLRSEARSFNIPTVLSYIYAASKAVNPILMVYYLHRRKNILAILIFIIQIFSFSINGSKTVLLGAILAAFLYWFYSQKYLYKIPWFLGLLGVASGLEMLVNNTFILIAFIVRRVYFVPNLLSYYYFDFFTKNSPDYFKQSFFRYFGFQSDYEHIANMMGSKYYNKPTMAANNGLISDAYTNLGWIGIIIMPFLLVLTFRLIDACVKGLSIKIFIISAITMTFIFISSFLFPILMTHGLFAVCIITYLLPRENELI